MTYRPEPITWDPYPDSESVATGQQQALEWMLDHLAVNFPEALDSVQASLTERARDAREGLDDEPDADGTDALLNLLAATR